MYFVHPQIKLNIKNLVNLLFCFFKKPDSKVFQKLKEMFPEKKIYFTDMGRGAFRLIVEKFRLQNSQILVPAFICDIFYDIFKKYNISPIFLDIEKETFSINPDKIKEKITPKVKSILLCHTYGLSIDIKKIRKILLQHLTFSIQHPIIIEDCAHSFGAKYSSESSPESEPFTGSLGDAAFFSLYKLFPTLRGGMVVLPKETKEIELSKTRFSCRDFISLLNCFSFFSFLFKKCMGKIASKYVRKEKLKEIGSLNRISLNIFFWQLKNFEKSLKKRRELALIFQTELKKLGFKTQNSENNNFTFLSAYVPENINRDEFVLKLRKKGVFLTRIWHTPIILNKEVQKEYNIDLSQFPNTKIAARRIVNFPLQNFYTKKDIEKMVRKIKEIIDLKVG